MDHPQGEPKSMDLYFTVDAGLTQVYVLLKWQEVGDLDFPMPIPVRVDGVVRRVEFSNNRALLQGVNIKGKQIDPLMQVLRKLSVVPTCEERRVEDDAAEAE